MSRPALGIALISDGFLLEKRTLVPTRLRKDTTKKRATSSLKTPSKLNPVVPNGMEKSGQGEAFAIVAVGASAGGLEAFTQLLRALPDDTGMAFVFIQHLDPKHRSLLSELLAKSTKMPVVEAKHGTTVAANHVYVIPPNVNMGILALRLQLTPRTAGPGLHTPIDFFMQSLAEARNSRAIGVVLSGTASDGTRGLAAIKAEGGVTFAQEEKSAKYSGMPHSAMASGSVDFILPPDKIGRELATIGWHPALSLPPALTQSTGVTERKVSAGNFDKIFALLRKNDGVNFSKYKPGTIQRRTLRRMASHKIEKVSDYAVYLEKHPEQTELLCQDLLIPVTRFFRDPEVFATLKRKVLPAIAKDKTNKGTLRIWAPGCSTGEETYSLAIVLLEYLGEKASSFQIQFFGTDANARGVGKARAGIYEEAISQEVSPARLRRFFTKVEGGYRVSKSVRDLCVFAKQNLVEDPPFSQMNLVVCRNLLIYLGSELQKKVMPFLHYALRPSGFLLLGNAESAAAFPALFAPVDKKHKIFMKKVAKNRLHYDFSANHYPRETATAPAAKELRNALLEVDQQQEADGIVLKRYAPPGVVIHENMEVVQIRGDVGNFIELGPGRATLNLLKLVKKELVAELRTALNQARKNQVPVQRKSVEFLHNGLPQCVNISVEPLRASRENHQYLIVFESAAPTVPAQVKRGGKLRAAGPATKEEIAELRRKVTTSEEHFRSLVESKEASDEQYQSANEEILSANEELQSTNEELETSQEELQSTNEELNTVNDELHNRNVDLDRAISDLNNVLASTSLPVVMVDRGLRIRRLTDASAKIFKVLPSDIGRPIGDIRSDINVPDLDQLIASVINTLTPCELEVQDKKEHWYSLQIRPYRTTDDKIDGAVVVLSDIDVAKKSSKRLQKSKDFVEDTLETLREPILVLDEDLKVQYANKSFLANFAVSLDQTKGRFLFDLGNGQWRIPKLRAALGEVVAHGATLLDFEVEHDFPGLGWKMMLLNARRIEDGHSDEPLMVLAIDDITERKRAEENVRVASERFRFMAESMPQKIFTATPAGDIDYFNQQWLEFAGLSFEQIRDWGWTQFVHPEDVEENVRQWQHAIDTGEPFMFEHRFRRADGLYRWHLSRAHAMRNTKGNTMMWIGSNTDIDDQKQAEQVLEKRIEARTASVRHLSLKVLNMQDEEHRNLSRELHDSLGQHLASMKMGISRVQQGDVPGKQTEILSQVLKSLDHCIDETRTISHLLHPPLLDELGFASAAKWYIEEFSRRSGIQVNLESSSDSQRLPRSVELPLFRVLQASLSNVHRHAGSLSVDVLFDISAGEAKLEIKDCGKGINQELLAQFNLTGAGAGIGLTGMRERMRELGGRLEIESSGNGTAVRAVIPVAASNAAKKSNRD